MRHDLFHAPSDVRAKSRQVKKQSEATKLCSCGYKGSCCEIFCAKPDVVEAEVACNRAFSGKNRVEGMCKLFEVSRSGYYSWRKWHGKDAKDPWLVDLIAECQKHSRQTYGIRQVQSWLQRYKKKHVNIKAILRVIRKLNLLSVIRRRRAYTRYQQYVHKYPNLLNRCFDQAQSNQFWVTVITFIPISGSMLYMCAVLRASKKLACGDLFRRGMYHLPTSPTTRRVTNGIRKALLHKASDLTAHVAGFGIEVERLRPFDTYQRVYRQSEYWICVVRLFLHGRSSPIYLLRWSQTPSARLSNKKSSLVDLHATVTRGLNTHPKHTST